MPQVHPSMLGRVAAFWKRKGTAGTLYAIFRDLLSYVIRHRCRLVFEVQLTSPREPSVWGPRETFLSIGPEEIQNLHPTLLATIEPEKHRSDFDSVNDGNRLFAVAFENYCLHRGYVCTVDRPALRDDRKLVFFDDLESVPMIRGSETTAHAGAKGIYRHVMKGLYPRVLNEQLRYLQSLGHKRATLFIMAENTLSIKGANAAGFHLSRVLNDWVLFRHLVFQKVCEKGTRKWRVVWL
jgi:hypothetical protein